MTSEATPGDELNKINSDFEGLSPALQSSVMELIEKEHFAQYEMTVKKFSSHGDNLLGKLYEIDIKCKTPESEKAINLFVKEKIILKNLTILNIEQLYANEELVYKHLSKIITRLQDQANVPLEERFKIAKAYDETSNNAIILENLRQKGFRIYNKTEPVSVKFFEFGVQELAKFHALSFVMERELPEYFKNNLAVLENAYIFDDNLKDLTRTILKYIADLYDDETKVKIEKFVPVILEKLPKYQKDKTNVCALSHGDYKKNNIMVRIIDGEPVEIIAVDYQLLDYGCPIRDLLYFIFTGTDREFRRKHMNDLKVIYFETLARFLKYFDMDVETVYPREEFERIYTEWLDYGLMLPLMTMFFTFVLETEVDFENNTFAESALCPDEKYHYMLRGVIDDFVEWGYL